MATNFKSIPIIDVGPLVSFEGDLRLMSEDPSINQVVNELNWACKNTGFFYVKNHGVPEYLMKEVRNATHQFFNLSYDEKLKIKMTAASGYRGYQKLNENLTKGVPDFQEAIDYYREIKPGMYGYLGKILEGDNQWPQQPENFKALMEEYIRLCTDLSRKIMRGLALALDGAGNEFEEERAGDAFWIMRLLGYPGQLAENAQNEIGCGVHTDYGVLTLINQDDDITALEVKNLSGEWIPATPISGTFVCNIGDMLKIWSNGIYEATPHRVVNNSTKYRVAVAYFYEPNFDTLVEPLEFCVEKSGGTRLKDKAVYGEHLVCKVKNNFGIKN